MKDAGYPLDLSFVSVYPGFIAMRDRDLVADGSNPVRTFRGIIEQKKIG